MMSVTIERLVTMHFMNKNKKIPMITGPGACKAGIVCHIGGGGSPQEGNYTGYADRNITMIGSRNSARFKQYIKRSVASDYEDMSKMNQTHYFYSKKAPNTNPIPQSCLSEINRTISEVV
jgi:hypothetical protein